FTLTLPNNATLSGISHIPVPSYQVGPSKCPLVVALHGGTCTAQHYDISPSHTSSTISETTGIPIVAIDRPCYGGTSSFLPLPEKEGFFDTTAKWLHDYILPALWQKFGTPNKCTGIVLLAHSMAVPPAILTAVMHAKDSNAAYPLAGVILTGFGAPGTFNNIPTLDANEENPDRISAAQELKRLMMVSEMSLGCTDAAMLPLIDAQSVPMPVAERDDFGPWLGQWETAAGQVEVPVLFAVGEHDWLWKADAESMDMFKAAFTKCRRFEGGAVLGAPHALEMWKEVDGWYERMFKFAREC
ncbi:hypothetical protein BDW02DRAFT_460037, partial [Decorospora gaudefroyi]